MSIYEVFGKLFTSLGSFLALGQYVD